MMNRYIIVRFVFFVFTFFTINGSVFAQSAKRYDLEWKIIDSLVNKMNQPKTALAKVNLLYQRAHTEKNVDQSVRALTYQLSLNARTKDDRPVQSIKEIDRVLQHPVNGVESALLWTMKAQYYWRYLKSNFWHMQQIDDTLATASSDWKTWTVRDFQWHIYRCYKHALSESIALKNAKTENYKATVWKWDDATLRPTLYDLVVQNALEFYSDKEMANFSSKDFKLNDSVAFGTTEHFLAYRPQTKDTLSPIKNSILLLQQLIRFHQSDERKEALIDLENQRLSWAYQNFEGAKDSMYVGALRRQLNTYPKNKISLQTAYLLAKYYDELGDKYENDKSMLAFRYKRVTAKSIVDQYLPKDSVYTEGWFNLRNLQLRLETPNLISAQMESLNVPEKPMLVWVQSYGVRKLYTKVIALRKGESQRYKIDSLLQVRPAVQQLELEMPDFHDFQSFSTEIKVDGLSTGYYALGISDSKDGKTNRMSMLFGVSKLAYFFSAGDIFVVDRETGAPISGVRLNLSSELRRKVGDGSQLISDKNGHIVLYAKKKQPFWVNDNTTLSLGEDSIAVNFDRIEEPKVVATATSKESDAEIIQAFQERNATAQILTDRNIYRPGQTVHFKALIASKDSSYGLYHIWKAAKPVTIFLKDANRKTLDSLTLAQDDFGTVQGKFRLPNGRLTGQYSLHSSIENGETYFQVEEYKRPTFFVETDTLKSTYRLNDSVLISGKALAYSGAKVSNATVKIHVERSARFPYFWLRPSRFRYSSSVAILDTIVKTDAQGIYSFRFPAIPDASVDSTSLPIFQFACSVEVTDPNGETRSTDKTVTIGYRSLDIQWNVDNKATIENLNNLKVSATNSNGVAVPAEIQVRVRPVTDPQLLLRSKYWDQPDVQIMDSLGYKKDFPHDTYGKENEVDNWEKKPAILDEKFLSDSLIRFKDTPHYGWYYLEATAQASDGQTVKDIRYIQYQDSKQIKTNKYLESFPAGISANIGDTVTQHIASAADKLYLVAYVQSREKADYTFLNLGKGAQIFTSIIQDPKDAILRRSFATYKDNRMYQSSLEITVTPKMENLDVRIKTFRDKVEPGAKEKWSVQVLHNGGPTSNAQLLSTMYDASLDQILDGNWSYGFSKPYYSAPYFYFNTGYNRSTSANNYAAHKPYLSYDKVYPYLVLDRTGPSNGVMNEVVVTAFGIQKKSFSAGAAIPLEGASAAVVLRGMRSVNLKEMAGDEENKALDSIDTQISNELPPLVPPSLRTNFNETAFFLPDITSDKEGNYWAEFTMPDAVTRWRWRNLAIDKELHIGYAEQMITSQKTLMLQPNMPRFLRAGDRLVLTAKISNLGKNSLHGKAYIQLLDADSSVLNWAKFDQEDFDVEADNNTVAAFSLDIPENYSGPLYVKTWAEGGNYSDGELHEIAVLSRKVPVTEMLPFEIKGDTSMHLTWEPLKAFNRSNTIDNQNFVVELATNPVWYAVQALPYLAYYDYECSEQLFNRMYAGFLAQKVVKDYPKIQTVLKQWENDPDALKSNLQKNEAVKQVVLEETPWINAAESEAVQKRRIAFLYNSDTTAALLISNFEKLAQRQLADGSFSWYDGNRGDRYITQYLVLQYAKLRQIGALDADWTYKLSPIMAKSQKWLTAQLDIDYKQLKKNKTNLKLVRTGSDQLQYLYAASLLDAGHAWSVTEKYYLQQAKKYWNDYSNTEKAWLADICYRKGEKSFALHTVLRSLMENAVENPTAGLYWKNAPSYWWGFTNSPIESHSQIMMIVNQIAQKEKNSQLLQQVREMQHWLIRNKQTNYWYNTKATAEACYATLEINQKWVNADPVVKIKLGDSSLLLENKEAGTGYTRMTLDKSHIKADWGDITLDVKNNPGYLYGGFYWQYLENMDKVANSNGPLSITKTLYREVVANGEKHWLEIKPQDTLAVGDKIMVRTAINSERDLMYVHLKDLRPSNSEPDEMLSGYQYQNGLSYYNSVKDVSNNYFFDRIPKGVHLLEYTIHLTHSGTFASGLASIQCMYAPEISSHSEGSILQVK